MSWLNINICKANKFCRRNILHALKSNSFARDKVDQIIFLVFIRGKNYCYNHSHEIHSLNNLNIIIFLTMNEK